VGTIVCRRDGVRDRDRGRVRVRDRGFALR